MTDSRQSAQSFLYATATKQLAQTTMEMMYRHPLALAYLKFLSP